MKNKILRFVAALLCSAGISRAQSVSDDISKLVGDIASSTNWTVIGGAGRATKGNRDLAFGAIAYNFNQNVGVVAGMDTLWAPGKHQNNVVKGGITLSAPIHPFAFLGSTFATNIIGTPFVAGLVAAPSGGSSDSVATIGSVGVNFDIVKFKNFELVAGAQYETRSGSGFWNGNYGLVHLGISRRF